MRRLLSFIAGLLAGGSLGAGISLLFAPQSGHALRQSMRERIIDLKAESSAAATQKEAELRQELADLTSSKTKVDTQPKSSMNGTTPH